MWGARYWGSRYWGKYWGKAGAAPVTPAVPGQDPSITLRFSDDGGNTWSNAYRRSLGKLGKFKTRIVWNGLGTGNDRVFEAFGSDPVKIALTGANFDAEILASSGRGTAWKGAPSITLRFSDDGGNTWSAEYQRSMGKLGQFGAVVAWNGLGTGNDRVFEMFGTDAVKIVLTGANFDAEILNS